MSIVERLCSQRVARSKPVRALALAISLSVSFGAVASSESFQSYQPVAPTIDQARANILIARQLQFTHFRDLRVSDDLSGDIFDTYLKYLDGQKVYLTQDDLDGFAGIRDHLGSALRTGKLQPGFDIYNLVQKRIIERLHFALNLLDQGVGTLDFSSNDSILLDRSDSDWIADSARLDELWTKRIKNAVLAQRLNGSDDDAITDTLRQRYQGQLKRAYQARSEDAFQAYMNAFAGMWDPHTSYFSPRTSENFNINMSLSLEGIGAVLQGDNEYTKVVRLVPGGPAFEQGQLQPADRIVSVTQEGETPVNVIGWRLDEVVDLIRGPRNSIVTLEVIPSSAADETITKAIAIKRDQVKLEEQSASKKVIEFDRNGETYKIGAITIPTFYADFQAMQAGDRNYKSTTRDVRRLLEELEAEGVEGLVIDLRNNGGGALHEANDLVGLFIDSGPTVQIRNANNDVQILNDEDPEVAFKGPLVVLVNRMSASASEIFAGAIQDYGRGLVVGSQTFGKGTVQAVRPLNHGQLKITQSKFYRVSGGSTQHKGVMPDIEIPSRIDNSLIGEDALDHALPWDQIDPVDHTQYFDFSNIIDELRLRHDKRFEASPEFSLLQQEIDFLKQQRQQNSVSLNMDERQQQYKQIERTRLTIANARRELLNETPFDTMEELDDWQDLQAADLNSNDEETDFVIREGGQIMADMLELDRRTAALPAMGSPLTAKAQTTQASTEL
ncbi:MULTISPECIES: carboxy terminal-processing peptidase [unclassified Marinobacter]|jgi:carboxyl-terminal processing protease|uniref:carboxy terminal-processing peptidase n=1 Tax=unclassified Marinobacter TaxID=83889 RepID=UPI00200E76E5|nr:MULTISPECIES: carboxy terminal-processing peptidase [unclassified Marinobacter]MCL1476947.1 carboxy terminal-processing peptidase [Marinobacter sp.]MCL1481310.1 carboxy terminal-processing peptidase [Marinobacter sp.]MCL1483421.1 carboxy terminal-processing peptidase [Marinobacter sp.]MCL1487717.1 carboxy terminal-processing peptidase [Marinobacter sp.]UQG57540.1 carboxy terminal-processing peptidase [Marinobacter sp. M4C]